MPFLCYPKNMEEVRFDSEQEFARPQAAAQGPRGLTALVMKWGLAKDEKTAQYILVGITVAAMLVMLFVWIGGRSTPPAQTQGALGWPQPIR